MPAACGREVYEFSEGAGGENLNAKVDEQITHDQRGYQSQSHLQG